MTKILQPKRSGSFRRWFRPYKPYLRANLDLGFMGFHTEIAHHAYEMDAFKYIELHWFFFKWRGDFLLYKPGRDD
jgi:hypothetical protein